MNNLFKDTLREALLSKEQGITRSIESLAAAGRGDEANMSKAARNIYRLCASWLDTLGDAAVYAAQLDEAMLHWRQAREQASLHGDHDRVGIEDAKLAALRDVRSLLDAQLIQEGRQA